MDRALHQLGQHPEVGVLGGRLLDAAGGLGHAGLLFSPEGVPYNRLRPQLGPLIDPAGPEALTSGPIPAVTGALMLLRRADFFTVGGLRESFRVCGEDVALCLDLWRQLGKPAYYASDVGGVHEEKSTRGSTPDQPDITAVSRLAAPLCQNDSAFQALQSPWALQEAELLCRLSHEQWQGAEELRRRLEEQQRGWEERSTSGKPTSSTGPRNAPPFWPRSQTCTSGWKRCCAAPPGRSPALGGPSAAACPPAAAPPPEPLPPSPILPASMPVPHPAAALQHVWVDLTPMLPGGPTGVPSPSSSPC